MTAHNVFQPFAEQIRSMSNPIFFIYIFFLLLVSCNSIKKEIGHQRYIEFRKILIDKNVNTTSEFLEKLKIVKGEKVADRFEEMLKTK